MSVDKLLKPETVAELLGLSVGTLANWRSKTRKENKLYGPPFINLNAGLGASRYSDRMLAEWQSELFDRTINLRNSFDKK